MPTIMKNLLIAFGLFICVVTIGTCTFNQHVDKPDQHPERDSISLRWKKEKEQLDSQLHKRIDKLQKGKDSLQKIVAAKKTALANYRAKALLLETKLKEVLLIVNSTQVIPDSLSPLSNEYFATQAASNNTCDSTITALEQSVANRDHSILLFKQSETNLRDLQREQELRNHLLTEQLNTAYKAQKKKVIQNKLLAGGLIFISGLTTTLLISQSLKK